MKKLLLSSLLAAAGCVSASAAGSYTSINSADATHANGSATAYGIALQLNGTRLTTSSEDDASAEFGTTAITLQSLTLSGVRNTTSTDNMGLALTDSDGVVLYTASLTAVEKYQGSTNNCTWTFDEANDLSTSDSLYFFFYDTSLDSQPVAGETLSNDLKLSVSLGYLARYPETTSSPSLGYLRSKSISSQSTSLIAPIITVNSMEYIAPGEPGNIPEPTSTTLSLLAIAGLAARRRRQ